MNAPLYVNREPFVDPRDATPAELLAKAEHQARGARLRMRAAVHDMEAAKVDLLRGDDDAHSTLRLAIAEYRAQYGIHLVAREQIARLRGLVKS